MQLTHKIALRPTLEQADYFKRACVTARRVWNWALAEWNRQVEAGLKPNAMALKKRFNAIKYRDPDWLDENGKPWLKEIHRDAHAQPFEHLRRAWKNYFEARKAGREVGKPTFKKKGRSTDSFYVANDKFWVWDKAIRLPKVGEVAMTEALLPRARFSARRFRVRLIAGSWQSRSKCQRLSFIASAREQGTVGIDLGVKAAAMLSTGEIIEALKPLKAALRRLRIRGRRVSRKVEAAKTSVGLAKGALLPEERGCRFPIISRNPLRHWQGCMPALPISERISLTSSRLVSAAAQAVVIEDLSVQGMLANGKLARAISDVGLGMFCSQIKYKAKRYGTRLVIADRWYPSSRLCSGCGWKNEALALKDREWTCPQCGTHHDRDLNAAKNLKRLATATALPVARPSSNGGTAADTSAVGGKVTPVRYDSDRGRKETVRTSAHVFDSRT